MWTPRRRSAAAECTSGRSRSRPRVATWWSGPSRIREWILINGKHATEDRRQAADQQTAEHREAAGRSARRDPEAPGPGLHLGGDRRAVGEVREVGRAPDASPGIVPGDADPALEPASLVRAAGGASQG